MMAENRDNQHSTLLTLIDESRAAKKPDLNEMRAWVERYDPCFIDSAVTYCKVYGEFSPEQIRTITVVRQLIEFLDGCAEHAEAIGTVFRAAAHRKQWKRR